MAMPNGHLDSYLHSTKKHSEWLARHKITLGLASAIGYLHKEWEQCLVHRNVDQAQQLYAGFGIQRQPERFRPCKTRGP
ncbi:unnamed protein product [Musa acuminata subsp. malaccensis]|uniref:(wild Malaysian banana) hypothetical protein n=1 Tax=Musa acuminata subsp. malaccensis TaxID=214687 RepID=A0A804KJE4_MUSAM|nr:unnamed protein product [Musa acuminata subsp. malaccensis]